MAITDPADPSGTHAQSTGAAGKDLPSLVQLAMLHAEAAETARLARLLTRAVPAAATLMLFGGLSFALAGGGRSLGGNFAWAVLVFIGVSAILGVAIRAGRVPFARVALKASVSDLAAALLYTGFAWGAGAFLVLPASPGIFVPLLFAGLPALALALWLRDRLCMFVFLAPVAAFSSFAAGLNPWPGAVLEAALILAVLAIIGFVPLIGPRRGANLAARVSDAL